MTAAQNNNESERGFDRIDDSLALLEGVTESPRNLRLVPTYVEPLPYTGLPFPTIIPDTGRPPQTFNAEAVQARETKARWLGESILANGNAFAIEAWKTFSQV
jgi:hypothetical protein